MSETLQIGIGCHFQHSFFSNGSGTAVMSLADALVTLGYKPILVNTSGKVEWWEDVQGLKDCYERRHLAEWEEKNYKKLDMFIDIDGYLIPSQRRKIANKVVVFVRKPTVIHEIESCVYPIQQPIKNYRDADAIWTWDLFGEQDAHILELLSSRPVFRIPYTWSASAIKDQTKTTQPWSEHIKQFHPTMPWICRITESNQSTTSNCTLPIAAVAQLKSHKAPIENVIIYNSTVLEQQQYFKDNIINHCQRDGLSIHYGGKQRCSDWRIGGKGFILSHTRFLKIKPMLLDLAWNGIPVLHNSAVLRDIGLGLERFYYEDCSILGIEKAFNQMEDDFKTQSNFFAPGQLEKIQSALHKQFSLEDSSKRMGWKSAIMSTINSTFIAVEEKKSTPLPIVKSPVQVSTNNDSSAPSVKQPQQQSSTFTKSLLTIGFSDLWQDANHEYNFWTLLLEEACRKLSNPIKVKGVKVTKETANQSIDLLIYGPFGDVWQSVSSNVPKVHITGENSKSVFGNGTYLNLGFEATDDSKGIYRFPLWIQYIDWFGANQDKLVNPKSMPIDTVTKVDKALLDKKSKFCAFVVSNPSNAKRNEAFIALSQYKKVDSAGRLFNNVGDALFVGTAGGGGGELKKLEFLKDYKFNITFENSRADGYVTEKFLAAKAAGCVPIYWGAMNVAEDFGTEGYINANFFDHPNQLITAVKEMDERPDQWLAAASKTVVDATKERKRLAEVAKKILAPILGDRCIEIPSLLGAGSTEEAVKLSAEREGRTNPTIIVPPTVSIVGYAGTTERLVKPNDNVNWNGKNMLVTFATKDYVNHMMPWLGSVLMRKQHDASLSIRVYLGGDVPDEMANQLKIQFPQVEFLRVPSETVKVEGFADLWNPQHFAWKLWIYQDLVKEAALEGTLVWYMDCASVVVRWPTAWIDESRKSGLCMLEDAEQCNYQWCHETFCKKLSVTDAEKAAQQIVGGIMAFVVGAKLPWTVFEEAWKWGQDREVITGPKWSGLLPNGKPFGHRHDQSILSILRLRHKVPVQPLSTVYNHESLRRAYKAGAALYIHRGQFKEHENFANRIGEAHIINLNRRKDRLDKFKVNHGDWTKKVCLRPAVDGRSLELTPALATLFNPNDFLWKKAIMGCALSHLSLWTELAAEKDACENYLIMEDDVKFQPEWLRVWEEASKHIPADYDVLYLGGVLPPNRGIYNQVCDPVNPFWNRIKPHQFFGQGVPNSYFHFCNYAYILSRRGAQKILEEIGRRGGYYTSADHMICNRIGDMKHYMLNPLVAGCYQDDDPKYQTSQFNNFERVDGFDSDLWNNDERFSETDILDCQAKFSGTILSCINDALRDSKQEQKPQSNPSVETIPSQNNRIYTIGDHKLVGSALMEFNWLKELLGEAITSVPNLPVNHTPLDTKPIFLVMKPHWDMYLPMFRAYQAAGKEFYAIHLSDEHCSDPIDWYSYPMCKGVVRIYNRVDCVGLSHVLTIPLGPNRMTNKKAELQERNLVWSFFGTKWQDREAHLTTWKGFGPNEYKFFDNWADANQLDATKYSEICLKSMFIPCPRGQNVETFRFYEALEHGCIPIYVREPGDELYFKMISSKLPILSFPNWEHALGFMQSLLQNGPTFINYRNTILEKWSAWKKELTTDALKFLTM